MQYPLHKHIAGAAMTDARACMVMASFTLTI